MITTRENLDGGAKEKFKASNKKRMMTARENLDESVKEKIKASDKKGS